MSYDNGWDRGYKKGRKEAIKAFLESLDYIDSAKLIEFIRVHIKQEREKWEKRLKE